MIIPSIDTLTIDPTDYLFFKEHAGRIVGKCAMGALRLAKAEQWLQDHDDEYRIRWEYDQDPDYSWLPDDDTDEHEVQGCILERRCKYCRSWDHAQSLWGIFDASPEYARVVEAELSADEMYRRQCECEGPCTAALMPGERCEDCGAVSTEDN